MKASVTNRVARAVLPHLESPTKMTLRGSSGAKPDSASDGSAYTYKKERHLN